MATREFPPSSENSPEHLRARIKALLSDHQLHMSPRGIRFLADLAEAVEHDPHPSWTPKRLKPLLKVGIPDFKLTANYVLQIYDQIFAEEASGSTPRRTLTTFDALHMISIRLEDLCPFTKK